MKGLWRQVCVWLSVQVSVALLCSLVLVQGVSAQTDEQNIDLSNQSGDVTIDSGGTWVLGGDLEGGVIVDALLTTSHWCSMA